MNAPAPPRRARLIALVIVAAIVFTSPVWLALGIRVYGFEAFRIPSPAMSPTLIVGDQVFVNKTTGGQPPARGDVIVFVFPPDPSKDFVSRVVGIAGDRVLARPDGVVEINGTPLPRCELGPWNLPGADPDRAPVSASIEQNAGRRYVVLHETGERPPPPEHSQCVDAPCEVPQGHVLTMGDNRDNSYDGRFWGFVPLANIAGRVSVIHGPSGNGPSGRFWHDAQGEPVLGPELDAARARCR